MTVEMAAQALCLAANIYFEARGEPIDGQVLVAEVTVTRAEERQQSICATVFEDGQFEWTATPYAIDDLDAFGTASLVADDVLTRGCQICSGATHYHAVGHRPYWSKELEFVGAYGNHIFYQEKQE